MILNEKGLTKRMSEAYKDAGYQVMMDAETVQLMGSTWAVICDKAEIPAEVLAMVVKDLGRIPAGNICCRIQKDGIQSLMPAVFLETMENLRKKIPEDGGDAIKSTPLTWRGSRIWQRERDLSLMRINPSLLTIVDPTVSHNGVCSSDGKAIAFIGCVSEAYILGITDHESDGTYLTYLAGMQWI